MHFEVSHCIVMFWVVISFENTHYSGYIFRPVDSGKVYLPLCEVADTPFHIKVAHYKMTAIHSVSLPCIVILIPLLLDLYIHSLKEASDQIQ